MIIIVYVKPKRNASLITYIGDNLYGYKEYDADLVSLPIDGKCNAELIGVLKDYFKVPKSQIKIVNGIKSRCKTIEINMV